MWEYWDCFVDHWKCAYEGGPHWNVLQYLAEQPELHITTPRLGIGRGWDLASSIADKAVKTGDTTELERLLSLGWDINSHPG